MRTLALLLIASAIGSCTSVPPAESAAVVAKQQAKLAELTAGKVAGQPQSCLPFYRSNDMVVVSEDTVAFKQGRSRVYVNHMQGACSNLDRGTTALVTRTSQSSLCRGDIATVVDTSTHTPVGSCVFGDFVPFTMAAR
jgi:hypothetical protein